MNTECCCNGFQFVVGIDESDVSGDGHSGYFRCASPISRGAFAEDFFFVVHPNMNQDHAHHPVLLHQRPGVKQRLAALPQNTSIPRTTAYFPFSTRRPRASDHEQQLMYGRGMVKVYTRLLNFVTPAKNIPLLYIRRKQLVPQR